MVFLSLLCQTQFCLFSYIRDESSCFSREIGRRQALGIYVDSFCLQAGEKRRKKGGLLAVAERFCSCQFHHILRIDESSTPPTHLRTNLRTNHQNLQTNLQTTVLTLSLRLSRDGNFPSLVATQVDNARATTRLFELPLAELL